MKTVEGKKIYSIAEVNYFAKQMLEEMIFWVEGEISSFKKNPNWNFYYLDLKDEKSILPCIVEGYLLEDIGEELVGQKILALGNLSLYEPFAKYQFKITRIEKFGEGILQRQLEELVRKLKGEGLFDAKYKKGLPKYPKKICVVTSHGSDAWNDFKRHTVDKFPLIELYTADIRVQGSKSIPQILKVLPKVDKMGFDVIVLTRGGGSIEDLAAFNDEQVARTIFTLKTPTLVAVGHEANESLAEWVADVRASTPTDAAHIVVSAYSSLLSDLENIRYKLKSKSDHYFSLNLQKLDNIYFRLEKTKTKFVGLPQKLADLKILMKKNLSILYSGYQEHLNNLSRSITILSPQNTLERGYSITTDEKGMVLKSVKKIVVGETIGVKLADGRLTSKVKTKQWQKENQKN